VTAGFRTIADPGPIRLAVVGAGGMGRAWLRAVTAHPEVALAGVVDVVPGAARRALDELGLTTVPAFESLAEVAGLPDGERPQAVVDVTVPAAHLPVTLEALALGLPVLGEKPAAATLTEALVLADAADRAGELFMVSQNRRYDRHLQGLRRRLPELGGLGLVSHVLHRAAHFPGFRERMAHPLLLDMSIHAFDTARMLLGGEPLSVHCDEFNPPWSWFDGDACAAATFEFPGGARFLYQGSWVSRGRQTSWMGEWRLGGSQGSAEWDGETPARLQVGDRTELCAPVEAPEDLAGTLAVFVGALRTGEPPSGEIRDNIPSLAMVHAAIEAATTGRRVVLADLIAAAAPPAPPTS
jgi:predicted dehydrogenase